MLLIFGVNTAISNSPEHPTLSSGLLDGLREMDPAGWSRLVSTFGPIVYRWCRTSGVPEADAPDIVQDVFAAVARGIANFRREKSKGSFRSWLATITRNKVRDHFRRQIKFQEAAGGTQALHLLEQQAESVDSTICPNSIDSPIIKYALSQVQADFESNTWDAFWLTVVDGKPSSEVAEKLGLSVDSVYQAKSRVLRRLRRLLSELPD